jgi:hypothetical protein
MTAFLYTNDAVQYMLKQPMWAGNPQYGTSDIHNNTVPVLKSIKIPILLIFTVF